MNNKQKHITNSSPRSPFGGRGAFKIIISGGGTGGHIYPAVAIADTLRQRFPEASILFVGAEGRMEMEKVPAAGYTIIGLPVTGLQRKRWWKNFSLPFKLWKSLRKAAQIIRDFQPDVVVGVGGYASAPVLWAAQRKKIPTLLQEQNSYAGIANKLLAKRASAICVAYDGMERFFPKEKIRLTGNPVRFAVGSRQSQSAVGSADATMDATLPTANCQLPTNSGVSTAHCDCPLPTVLVVGGSLGARTLNQAMIKALPELRNSGVRFIWQTGKAYFKQAKAAVNSRQSAVAVGSGDKRTMDATLPTADCQQPTNSGVSTAYCDCQQPTNSGVSTAYCDCLLPTVTVVDFISRMDEAFAAADIVVSRAGAGTISELCVAAKACVFVPSPNVAEDHQTKNAQALVAKNAALMVRDDKAIDKLLPTVLELLHDKERIKELEKNIAALAKLNAANEIVDEIIRISQAPPAPEGGAMESPQSPLAPKRGTDAETVEMVSDALNFSPFGGRGAWAVVYFLGIGGIGMSALARYYKHAGARVAGYDRTPSPLTAELEREGMDIHYEDDITLIPPAFTAAPEKVLVIYTPALPADHRELNYFKERNYTLVKRSKALGHIAATKTTLAVAGTHGKSTVTTLLAHLLTQAGGGCTAFLGGISKNYHSNLLLSDTPALVAEADEFDRSFLQLFPQIAIITATDADHLDIYGTADAVKQAFVDFAGQVQSGGALIVKRGVDSEQLAVAVGSRQSALGSGSGHSALVATADCDCQLPTVYRYSLDQPCDFYASNIRRLNNGLSQFDLHLLGEVLPDCTLGIPGRINVENAVAAAAAAYLYMQRRIENGEWRMENCDRRIKEAFASFAGVQRRFDVQFNTPACTYIDDYAHHPEELRAAITSLREVFPQRKITGIFQPHLYTRTRDFAEGFAESLSLLDELILLDIYPARELPIAGVSSQIIFDRVTIPHKQMCTKDELMNVLKTITPDVLITFGAGDIDRFVQPIKKWLENEV